MAHIFPIFPVLLLMIFAGCGSTSDILPLDWATAQLDPAQLHQSEGIPGELEIPEDLPDLLDGEAPPPAFEMLVATSTKTTCDEIPNVNETQPAATGLVAGVSLESESISTAEPELAQKVLGNELQLLSGIQVDRQNPFSFAEGYTLDDMQNMGTDSQQKLRLYGFVGKQTPRVILRMGEATRILAKGEKWLAIEVLEITPPSVKLRAYGVLKELSILDDEPSDTQKGN